MAETIDGPRIVPQGGVAPEALIVFLHGYGADGNDLIEIGRAWSRDLPTAAFVAPNALEPCSMNPMGRQWFDLTMRDPSEYKRGVNLAQPQLDQFLDQELEQYGLDDRSLALVGFSQGTMMALHVGLLRPQRIGAIVGYSGLFADPDVAAMPSAMKPPILLAHGDQDEVIPAGALFAAANGLAKNEIGVEWHITPGLGHGIGPDGLEIGQTFVRKGLGL